MLRTIALATTLAAFAGAASAHRAPPPHSLADQLEVDEPPPPEPAPHFAQAPRIAMPALDRAKVRAALAAARAKNLAAFHAYATAGVYPSNVYQAGELNVWRDQDGHFCAAATVIRASGQVELVDRVADQNNNIKLADVTTGPLMDWILTSGLTQDELALIQRPFRPVTAEPVAVPVDPVVVDTGMRAKETARLRGLYKTIETKLAKQNKTSLDAATDRLMKRPQLAWRLEMDYEASLVTEVPANAPPSPNARS